MYFSLLKFKVSFHPSGNYLVSGSQDGSIKIFDLLEARPIYDLLGHKSSVTAVKFSSKGNFFASGSEDKMV
jgi:centriolar protein POC1